MMHFYDTFQPPELILLSYRPKMENFYLRLMFSTVSIFFFLLEKKKFSLLALRHRVGANQESFTLFTIDKVINGI